MLNVARHDVIHVGNVIALGNVCLPVLDVHVTVYVVPPDNLYTFGNLYFNVVSVI